MPTVLLVPRVDLEAKLVELRQRREHHLAMANAAQGAILLCEELLRADAPPDPTDTQEG